MAKTTFKAIMGTSYSNYQNKDPVYVVVEPRHLTIMARDDASDRATIDYDRIISAEVKYKIKEKSNTGCGFGASLFFGMIVFIPIIIAVPWLGIIVMTFYFLSTFDSGVKEIPFVQLVYYTSKGEIRGLTLTRDKSTWSAEIYNIYEEIYKRANIKEKREAEKEQRFRNIDE